MTLDVEQSSGTTTIQGVPPLAWGTGQDCTFAGALASAMAVTGHPYSYAELMGLSGLAFRTRWANDETATQWCCSSAVGECPDEVEALHRLTGWQLHGDVQFGEENPDKEAIRTRIVSSIDDGQPVVVYASTLDMAVIYGYQDHGAILLASDYCQQDEPYRLPAAKIGPMQTYLGVHTAPPSRREALTEALRFAVRNWHRAQHDGGIEGRAYWYGDAAFKAWMRDLRRFEKLDEETQERLFGLDRWCLIALTDARQAAVAFLKGQAQALEGESSQALQRAVRSYEHVVEVLAPALAERVTLPSAQEWPAEARQRETEVLAEVYQAEAQAIAAIELAIKAVTAVKGQGRVILKDVDCYQVMDPMFESVRIVLAHRGEPYSPPYIQGLSGSAFRIGGICPCAPTCACAMGTQDLIRLLGYEMEELPLYGEGVDPERDVERVIERITDEIRAGRPAIVWHAFTTAEWDVVCGFDDAEHLFYGRGSYAGMDELASAGQGRMGTYGAICPPMGAILIGERATPFDARAAEIAALTEAVRHARSQENVDRLDEEGWVMLYGLACYDRWIADFRQDPPRLPTMGDRYCFGVNRSTHRAAAGFLRELKPKYPRVAHHLERAAEGLVREADALNECAQMLFPDWQLPERADADQNARTAVLLVQARESYAQAIDEIEAVLAEIA